MAKQLPDMLTATQAAKVLGLHRTLVCKYIREERIKGHRVGKMYVIPKSEVVRFSRIERPYGNPNFGKS